MISHSGVHQEVGERNVYQVLNRYISYLLWVTVLVYILGMITYGDSFTFWDKAYSHIGSIRTVSGNPNTLSLLIFGLGMLLSSWICIRSSNILPGQLNHYFFRLCGVGYLLLIVPCDLINLVHSIGGALVFGTLWLFTTLHLKKLYHHVHRYKIYLYHFILQGTVLPYAFLYAIRSPAQQSVQKLALFGLMLILKIVIIEHVRIIQNSAARTL